MGASSIKFQVSNKGIFAVHKTSRTNHNKKDI
jgi:hypothetical protein